MIRDKAFGFRQIPWALSFSLHNKLNKLSDGYSALLNL